MHTVRSSAESLETKNRTKIGRPQPWRWGSETSRTFTAQFSEQAADSPDASLQLQCLAFKGTILKKK